MRAMTGKVIDKHPSSPVCPWRRLGIAILAIALPFALGCGQPNATSSAGPKEPGAGEVPTAVTPEPGAGTEQPSGPSGPEDVRTGEPAGPEDVPAGDPDQPAAKALTTEGMVGCEREIALLCTDGLVDGCLKAHPTAAGKQLTTHHICARAETANSSSCMLAFALECGDGMVDACVFSPGVSDIHVCVKRP